jgi:hypothetical protein
LDAKLKCKPGKGFSEMDFKKCPVPDKTFEIEQKQQLITYD